MLDPFALGYTLWDVGLLTELASGRQVALGAEVVIGRSPRSEIVLSEGYVSVLHASLRWVEGAWRVRDLGSRNGTWVNRRRLELGQEHELSEGDGMGFGRHSIDWVLADAAPPGPELVALSNGRCHRLGPEPLSLPSAEQTVATVYCSSDGTILFETDSELRRLGDDESFEVQGHVYVVRALKSEAGSTQTAPAGSLVRDAWLDLVASSSEEHVTLRVRAGGREHSPRPRLHNYLLLVLARQRLADRRAGHGPEEEGWVGLEDLCHRLRCDRSSLNTDVYRIRKQFADLGLSDPMNVIERRTDADELRVGIARLRLEP